MSQRRVALPLPTSCEPRRVLQQRRKLWANGIATKHYLQVKLLQAVQVGAAAQAVQIQQAILEHQRSRGGAEEASRASSKWPREGSCWNDSSSRVSNSQSWPPSRRTERMCSR